MIGYNLDVESGPVTPFETDPPPAHVPTKARRLAAAARHALRARPTEEVDGKYHAARASKALAGNDLDTVQLDVI